MTGYTYTLEEMGFDFHKWMVTSISRAFGFTIMFREDGAMDEATMNQAFQKEVADAEAKLKKLLDNPPQEFAAVKDKLRAELEESNAANLISNKEYAEKHALQLAGLKDSYEKACKYKEIVRGTEMEGTADFVLQQIGDSIKHCGEEPYQKTIKKKITAKDVRESYYCDANSYERSVEYAREDLDREEKRYEFFKQYVAAVKQIA